MSTEVIGRNVTVSMPIEWGKDDLTTFFDTARGNQVATFANKPDASGKLRELDDCYIKIGTNLINPPNIMAPFFLYRSHSAFRCAAGFAMAGQIPEAFVQSRSSLEYASYGLLIANTPGLGETWLNRHKDKDSLKAVKKAFVGSALEAAIAVKDTKLAENYSRLYQDSIDWGAHPNERGMMQAMQHQQQIDRTVWLQMYIQGDGPAMDNALKHVAQVGLTVLFIFAHVFRVRYMLLGLDTRIQQLRAGL